MDNQSLEYMLLGDGILNQGTEWIISIFFKLMRKI
jgi:hypothetical protein